MTHKPKADHGKFSKSQKGYKRSGARRAAMRRRRARIAKASKNYDDFIKDWTSFEDFWDKEAIKNPDLVDQHFDGPKYGVQCEGGFSNIPHVAPILREFERAVEVEKESLFGLTMDFSENTFDQLNGLVDRFNTIVHNHEHKHEWSVETVDMVVDMCLAIGAVYSITTKNQFMCLAILAIMMMRYKRIVKHVQSLVESVTNFFGVAEHVAQETTVQSESKFEFKNSAITIVGGLFLYRLLDGIHYCNDFDSCLSFATQTIKNSFGSGYVNAFDVFLKFLQSVIDSIWGYFKGTDCPLSLIPRRSREIHALLKELTEIDVLKNTNALKLTEIEMRIEELVEKLSNLLVSLPKESNTHVLVTQTLIKYRGILAEVKSLVRSASGSRIEPVCFILVGPAGCGKTSLNRSISNKIIYGLSSDYMRNHYASNPADLSKNIYAYDGTAEFWNGYRNQLLVSLDEASPRAETHGVTSLPQRVIKMVQNISYPLNMADLGKKETTFFNSRVILGSTNARNWNDLEGVACPEAFWRRVTFLVFEPRMDKLKEEFGDDIAVGIDDPDYPAFRSHVARHMYETAERFQTDPDMTFEEYVNESYKFMEFNLVTLTSKQTNLNEATRKTIQPSDFIQRVIDDAERKEKEHVGYLDFDSTFVRKEIARSNTNVVPSAKAGEGSDMPGAYHNPIQAEGVMFSTLSNRYKVPQDMEDQKTTEWRNAVEDNTAKFRRERCVPMMRCGCEICQNYIESKSPASFATKCLRKKGMTITALQREKVEKEVLQADPPMTSPSTACGIDSGTSPCEVYGKYYQYAYFVDQAVKLCVVDQEIKALKIGYAGGLALFDFATLSGILLIARMLYNKVVNKPSSSQEGGIYPMRPKNKGKAKMQVRTIEGTVQKEGDNLEFVTSFARNNVYRVEFTGKFTHFTTHFTMVQNNLALAPTHVIDSVINCYKHDPDGIMHVLGCMSMKKGQVVVKQQQIPLHNLIYEDEDVIDWRGGIYQVLPKITLSDGTERLSDLSMVYLPVGGLTRYKHFAPSDFFESEMSYHRQGTLATITDNHELTFQTGDLRKYHDWESLATMVPVEEGSSQKEPHWFGKEIFEYDMHTGKGKCGAPIFVKIKGVWKIGGIHAAGSTEPGKGYAIHCSSERVEACINRYIKDNRIPGGRNVHVLKEQNPEGIVQECSFIKSEAIENAYGHLTSFIARSQNSATQTKIIKSPFHGMVKGPDKAPAKLTPFVSPTGEIIDPMEVAQSGYGDVNVAPPLHAVQAIVENTWQTMGRLDRLENETLVPRDWKLVVDPQLYFDYVRKMPRNTSPGYPWILSTRLPGKQDFFGSGEEYTYDSPACIDLFAKAEQAEQLILSGIRPFEVCMSFLKDERRPMDRVLAGKTRLVSGSSILMTLLLRKYTMGFLNWVVRHKVDNSIAIGVNPYSGDWNHIAAHHGYSYFQTSSIPRSSAGDHSGFDKSLHYLWIVAFADVTDLFYQDTGTDQAFIRRALIMEVGRSRHIVNGNIVEWIGSNTSGNAITTLLNSFVNIFVMKYGCVEAYLSHNGYERTMLNFYRVLNNIFDPERPKIKMTVFGDDVLLSLMAHILPETTWFNPRALSDSLMKHLGLKFTEEDKGDTVGVSLRTIADCTFLKRGFRRNCVVAGNENHWSSPLDLETIRDSIRWMKRDGDGYEIALDHWAENVATMLEELSQHDEETYLSVGTQIIQCANKLRKKPPKLPIVLPRREDLQAALLEREMEY